MATWLKQSTAIEIKLGPFVSSSDGFTAQTALTISQADVRLAKGPGDWAQKSEATSAVHEENGWYRVLLDTTDTNTLGTLIVAVNESGALPVWREFMVMKQTDIATAVWEEPAVDHQAMSTFGRALGDPDMNAGVNTCYYMLNQIINGVYPVYANINDDQINSFSVAASGAAEIASAVWDKATTGHTTSGTFGEQAKTDVDAILAKTASLTFTVAGQVDANIQSVNDTTVTGSGTGGSPWGP